MDISSDVKKVETAAAQDIAYAQAAVRKAEADAAAAKSWIEVNWHYALGIAVGALFAGAAIGVKFAPHHL
jgi:hypothetical protein